ncbi:hypothetical protein FSW04_06235 [Baekduia soli]|uniref:Uncharacterized protein n=1 Tax=Baekduia soli TaxID=496014 RepID=A0A5B8U2B9_9ACTN|nr:hypothetical protein [Baekduia soli]QEC47229.1 hypothetical protein FSW04_06235 [Baekduia soli]
MPAARHTPSLPVAAALAVASCAAGALAAFTDGAEGAPVRRAAPPAVVVRVPVPAAARPGVRSVLRPLPAQSCRARATPRAPAAEPVPQDLLDAFGVLRRDAADGDALPAEALRALRARGLEPFDPAAARLLRSAADGARAWVVPVRDVAATAGCVDVPTLVPGRPAPARPTPAPPRPAPAPTAIPPVPPAATVPSTPTPALPAHAARPGLAVVALGGAPAGGGGAFADLVRGRGAITTDPCGGPGHDMLAVSGIVPDGVAAAFLTAPDGTAVRADVHENAYAFVVPRPSRPDPRYVVWTGADGTPHVQPVPVLAAGRRPRCATPPGGTAVVTPGGLPRCLRGVVVLRAALVVGPPVGAAPCPPARILPVPAAPPATAVPAPVPRRHR